MPIVLKAAGCVIDYEDPWRTGRKPELGMESRPREIEDWLEEHGPVDDYVILDDDGFEWTEAQRERWVACDSYNGLSLSNFTAVLKLLGAEWPQASKRSHAYPTLPSEDIMGWTP